MRKLRRDLEPGGVRSRMTMEKEDGKAGSAAPRTDLTMRCRHVLFREAFKKVGHLLSFGQDNIIL